MINAKPHIVFFTPTLNRTGSEIVLCNLLPFAKEYFDITVIVKYKGDLYAELPNFVKRDYLYNKQRSGLGIKINNFIRGKFIISKKLRSYIKATWYINTALLPDILKSAEEHNVKTVVHLHELEQMYSRLSQSEIKRLVTYPQLIIANSNASASVIIKQGRKEKIEIVYPAIDCSKNKLNVDIKKKFRKQLNLNPEVFLWVMCGTLDKNKNPKLFIDIAVKLKKINDNFKMMWIGGSNENVDFENKVKRISEEKQVSDVIIWLGDVKNEFHNYFSCADGFVLTSEFESFSLVTLEALLLGLPIVANNCGGVSEILNGKFGQIISEKNNVFQFVEAMQQVTSNKNMVNENELVERGNSFDINVIGKQWVNILKNNISA